MLNIDQQHILLVDDDELIRRVIGTAISDGGYQTIVCATGHEALASCEQARPVLAIIDYLMPEMSGIELASRLRELKIPFTFLTSCDNNEVSQAAISCGTMGYLTKPVQPEQLLLHIESALSLINEMSENDERAARDAVIARIAGYLCGRLGIGTKDAIAMIEMIAESRNSSIYELCLQIQEHQNVRATSNALLSRNTPAGDAQTITRIWIELSHANEWLDQLISDSKDFTPLPNYCHSVTV
ncbi:MAG: response regulator [Gammaproteobacteria bacterium]